MRETWYVLEDGNVADPSEVAPDEKGALRNKGGMAVAMKGDVPHTRGVDDADAERAKAKKPVVDKKEAPESDNREMAAKPGKGYKTR